MVLHVMRTLESPEIHADKVYDDIRHCKNEIHDSNDKEEFRHPLILYLSFDGYSSVSSRDYFMRE